MPRRYLVTLIVFLAVPVLVTACDPGNPTESSGGSAPTSAPSQPLLVSSQIPATPAPSMAPQMQPTMGIPTGTMMAMMPSPVPPGANKPAQPNLSDLSYEQTTIAPGGTGGTSNTDVRAVVKRVVLKNAALNLTVEDPVRTVQQV